MQRSFIIDPSLKGSGGHHLSLAAELSKAAQDIGHLPVWLGHRDFDFKLAPKFVTFIPKFSSDSYERQIGIFGRTLKPLVGYRRWLRSTLGEQDWEVQLRHRFQGALLNGDRCNELLDALDSLQPTRKDHVIIPSADPQLVDMLNTWASSRPRDQLPQIHVRTCWSTANMPFSSYGGGFVNVVRRLSDICPNVNLSAETPAGAALLVSETGLEVGFCPHLIEEETLNVALPAKAPERLYVGWLGDPRPEKGAGIITEIIGKALQRVPAKKVKFLLQCGGRKSRKARSLYDQLAQFGDAVELVPSVNSREEYQDLLERCGVMLLPYDETAYPPERGSGVALEALLTGRPMVATANTYAAELITAESGVTGTGVNAIVDGIVEVTANYEHYLAGAARARDSARKIYDRVGCYRALVAMTD